MGTKKLSVRLHVWVTGRVQGVYFRESTRVEAEKLGVLGWIRNLPDGRVETVFEGDEQSTNEFLSYLQVGPERASVKSIEVTREPVTGEFSEFAVLRRDLLSEQFTK